ncbi:Drug resistance transporter, EmrB/QacA subfamily [Kyrpidia spormannii]|uniref:Drug resistance transporter, EmrB/QacA subfamily n=1 Tax=Kyrpidia spormannii TaxID=2055160 RepID=A0ACA8Z658_9BACL|nr:Drug resistance transporter, EmrB/QacA subfamily [Kyrpidia spormannii]
MESNGMPRASLEKAGQSHEPAAHRWLVFISVVIGTFMVNVDSSIVNVAVPVLQRDFHVGPGALQWVISGYLLVVTATLPMIGGMSDRTDRRTCYIAGVTVFSLGSALCAWSTDVDQLIVFRLVQALGGAAIMGNVMSIISYTFPAGQRGRPLGLVNSVVAAGTIVGPALGGALTAAVGWQAIFWVNVPLGMISIVMSLAFLRRMSTNRSMARFDWMGSLWFFVAMAGMLLFMSNGNSWGWISGRSILAGGVSIGAWLLFIMRESRIREPLIDLRLFRSARFAIGNVAGYLSYVIMMFPTFILPLFLHQVMHEPIAHVGLLMTSQAVAMILISPVAGWLTDKYGPKWPTTVGMAIATAALLGMAGFGSGTSKPAVVAAQALFGLGMGLFTAPNNVSILESVPVAQTGLIGSLLATIRNFGRVSGVALAVVLLETAIGTSSHYSESALVIGSRIAFGSAAILGAVATLLISTRMAASSKTTVI